MKRLFAVLMVLAVAAAAVFIVGKRWLTHHPRAAQLAPAETILFVQLPDTLTTSRRFTQTALWRIANEPEVQDAFANAQRKSPLFEDWSKFASVLPREGFAAVTSLDGKLPTFVAGFAFSGPRKWVEDVAANWRGAMREVWPAGKSDLLTHGDYEIETFADKDFAVAETIASGWYLISNDLDLLRHTLDRLDAKPGVGASLAESAIFQAALEPLPREPDALVVAQAGPLIERLASLLVASGQQNDPAAFDDLRKTKAIAFASKFDGALCRDSIFVLQSESKPERPLARHALGLSSPESMLLYTAALPVALELSEKSADLLALIPGWDAVNAALAEKGLTLADLPKAFGPEIGGVLDWPEGAERPAPLLVLDVRDAQKATALVELLTGGKIEGFTWRTQESDGATIFTNTDFALGELEPTIAIDGSFVIAGLDPGSVSAALARLKSGGATLSTSARFAAASQSVAAATTGFGYLDVRGLFERTYSLAKPAFTATLAATEEAGQYFDAGKLPDAPVIAQHLSPLVYSQAATARGTLVESSGPVSLSQLFAGAIAAAIGVGAPALEAAQADGKLPDPSQLLKSLSGPQTEPAEPQSEREP
jgi:hypothetical protein